MTNGEQGTTDLVFHASGLLAGQSYALRAVLFERSNALAVSMRSFRVGAVSVSDGVEDASPVTIQVLLLLPLYGTTVATYMVCVFLAQNNVLQQHTCHARFCNPETVKGSRKRTDSSSFTWPPSLFCWFCQTALQVALTYHTVGGQLQAEQIYR